MVGRRRRVVLLALVALAGAVPTLVSAAWSPGLIVDDWALAAHARWFTDPLAAGQPGRPLANYWYFGTFNLLGARPVPNLLLLAAVNAVCAVLVWEVARRLLPRRCAVLATAVWLVAANRGSTRLWIILTPNSLALVAVLAAVLLARAERHSTRRHLVVVALGVMAMLFYEGASGLAAGVVALSAWRWTGRERLLALAGGGLVLAATAAWEYSVSPKTDSVGLFRGAGRWVSTLFGAGILPAALAPLGLIALAVAVYCLATLVLPSFATRDEERVVIIGAGVLMLGMLPFWTTGFLPATDGIFDRGNHYASLGAAVVIAGALALLWRVVPSRAAVAVAVVVLGVMAAENAVDVSAFHLAAEDGRRLLRSADRLPEPIRTRGPVVFPDLPNRHGVSMFVEDYDISAALALRYDTGYPYPDAAMASFAKQRTR